MLGAVDLGDVKEILGVARIVLGEPLVKRQRFIELIGPQQIEGQVRLEVVVVRRDGGGAP